MALAEILEEIERQSIVDGDIVIVIYNRALFGGKRTRIMLETGRYARISERDFTIYPTVEIQGLDMHRYNTGRREFGEHSNSNQPLVIQKVYAKEEVDTLITKLIEEKK